MIANHGELVWQYVWGGYLAGQGKAVKIEKNTARRLFFMIKGTAFLRLRLEVRIKYQFHVFSCGHREMGCLKCPKRWKSRDSRRHSKQAGGTIDRSVFILFRKTSLLTLPFRYRCRAFGDTVHEWRRVRRRAAHRSRACCRARRSGIERNTGSRRAAYNARSRRGGAVFRPHALDAPPRRSGIGLDECVAFGRSGSRFPVVVAVAGPAGLSFLTYLSAGRGGDAPVFLQEGTVGFHKPSFADPDGMVPLPVFS